MLRLFVPFLRVVFAARACKLPPGSGAASVMVVVTITHIARFDVQTSYLYQLYYQKVYCSPLLYDYDIPGSR